MQLPKIATWFLNNFDLPTFQHNRNYPIDCVGANNGVGTSGTTLNVLESAYP